MWTFLLAALRCMYVAMARKLSTTSIPKARKGKYCDYWEDSTGNCRAKATKHLRFLVRGETAPPVFSRCSKHMFRGMQPKAEEVHRLFATLPDAISCSLVAPGDIVCLCGSLIEEARGG